MSKAGCYFPDLYTSADTFVPERTLGMALRASGSGKELLTYSPVGVQLLLTFIPNEPCPGNNTTNYLTRWAKSCSTQTLNPSYEWESPISTEVITEAN